MFIAAEHGIFEAGAGAAASWRQFCTRVPHHILLTSLPLCSSTSTPWPPPSSRRCFRQIPLPVQPFRSCSMTSFSLLAISLPASPSPASPFRPGFQLLPVAWTPAAGSLSPSSIKVNRGLGRQQTPREPRPQVCEWMAPIAQVCGRTGPSP